jgi:hypothetical protein
VDGLDEDVRGGDHAPVGNGDHRRVVARADDRDSGL